MCNCLVTHGIVYQNICSVSSFYWHGFKGEELFLFMEPTSPKGKDLQRDPRYTLRYWVCPLDAKGTVQ